jgi:hypothetical protein
MAPLAMYFVQGLYIPGTNPYPGSGMTLIILGQIG